MLRTLATVVRPPLKVTVTICMSVVCPLASATSTCRDNATICSGLRIFIGIPASLQSEFSFTPTGTNNRSLTQVWDRIGRSRGAKDNPQPLIERKDWWALVDDLRTSSLSPYSLYAIAVYPKAAAPKWCLGDFYLIPGFSTRILRSVATTKQPAHSPTFSF